MDKKYFGWLYLVCLKFVTACSSTACIKGFTVA